MNNLPNLALLGLLASSFACSGSGVDNAPSTDQTLVYSAPTVLPCAARPVTVADFNGDGLKDLMSACRSDSSPSTVGAAAIYINQGGGSFGDPADPGIDEQSESPWVFDVNRDGRDDLVTGARVFLGQADGTFAAPFSAQIPDGLSCCDLDADGHPDVVTETGDYPGPFTVIGYSIATDASKSAIFTFQGTVDELADVDHDGNVDVLSFMGSSVLARFNRGAGRLDEPRAILTAQAPISDFDIVDIDGDKIPDVVLHLQLSSDTHAYVLARNSGNASFVQTAVLPDPDGIITTFVDATGDGKVDVVLTDNNGGLAILPGRGDSTFGTATLINGPWTNATGCRFVDLTGRHKLDLVVGDQTLSVLLRQ